MCELLKYLEPTSGSTLYQYLAVIFGTYVMYRGYEKKDWLLFAIGLGTILGDGYILITR